PRRRGADACRAPAVARAMRRAHLAREPADDALVRVVRRVAALHLGARRELGQQLLAAERRHALVARLGLWCGVIVGRWGASHDLILGVSERTASRMIASPSASAIARAPIRARHRWKKRCSSRA